MTMVYEYNRPPHYSAWTSDCYYPVYVDSETGDDWDSLSPQEKADRLKREIDEVLLPRLAALESGQPVRLPLDVLPQPVQWDGIP